MIAWSVSSDSSIVHPDSRARVTMSRLIESTRPTSGEAYSSSNQSGTDGASSTRSAIWSDRKSTAVTRKWPLPIAGSSTFSSSTASAGSSLIRSALRSEIGLLSLLSSSDFSLNPVSRSSASGFSVLSTIRSTSSCGVKKLPLSLRAYEFGRTSIRPSSLRTGSRSSSRS